MFDQNLSTDLEWVQLALDAYEALPLTAQGKLREDATRLRNLKRQSERGIPCLGR